MAEPTQRRTGRRIAIAIAVVIAVPILLVAAALALLDSGAITKRVMDAVLPRASAALGREVAVRGAELDLFPHPRVRLDGLTVAGRPGEPPLVAGDAIQAEVALWPLLASLGRTVEVRAVVLEKPVVNLVRGKDGVWNYEGLGGGSGSAAKEPPAPAPQGGGTNVVVRRFAISDGAVHVIDHTTGAGDAGVALEKIGLDASNLGTGLPLAVKLRAALAAKQENLAADLSVSALPSGLPQRPEDWPQVTGSLSLKALALDRLRPLFPAGTSAVIRGGTVGLDAKVATDQGAYRVDGSGDLRDLRLRGQAASGRFRAIATVPQGAIEKARVEIPEVAVKGPGVDLSGNAAVEQAPLRARFALRGPLLDLDALMGALPPSEAAADEQKPAAGGEVLPAPMRKQVRAASATGTLELGELRSGKLRATDVKAHAVLRDGVLVLEDLAAGLFGGKLDASGTRVSLAEAEPTWSLKARVEQLDLGEAMRQITGAAPVVGRTDMKLDVSGKGIDWAKLKDQVTGAAALAIRDGQLTTVDLGGQVLGAVSNGLRAIGKSAAAEKVGGVSGKTTSLKDLAGNFAIQDGWLAAEKPVRVQTPIGPIELGGKVGLDMRLDLAGSAAVSREALAGIAPSGVKLPASLQVPLGMGGTLRAPSVNVRADEAVKGLLRGQAEEAKKAIQQEAEKKGKAAVDDLFKRFKK